MNYIKMLVVGLLVALVTSLFSGATPAQATAPVAQAVVKASTFQKVMPVCHTEIHGETLDFHDNNNARARVYYNWCILPDGHRYVVPRAVSGAYWDEARNCSGANPFRGYDFNFYLFDLEGRNINPAGFTVGCEADGNNSRYIAINPSRTRLHYVDGKAPRWKANVTRKLDFGIPDTTKVAAGYLSR